MRTTTLALWTAGSVLCVVSVAVLAQAGPLLHITQDAPSAVRLNWNSEPGTNYQLLSTLEIDPFSLWSPIGTAIEATNTTTSTVVSNSAAISFFKLHIQNEFAGLPTARIASLTNGQSVSGVILVQVGAQDDSRLSAVSLYLDDNLIASITAGDLNFTLDTTHFPNGSHTLVARAQDNAGIPYLGGTLNNNTVANEVYSDPVTLTFENVVRWPDAETLFETDVPINAESDIFPSDWTVFVENSSGTVLRTISGNTQDGLIQTNWDGTDNNSVPVPSDANYKITVALDTTSSMQSQQSYSSLGYDANGIVQSRYVNKFGVIEFEVEQKRLDPMPGYLEVFGKYLGKEKDEDTPPIPPPPIWDGKDTVLRKVSLKEMFMAHRSLSSAGPLIQSSDPTAGGQAASGGAGVATTIVWRETTWTSGKIILARQRYRTLLVGATFNAGLGLMLNGVAALIEAATQEVGNHRGVYNNTVFVVPDNGGYGVLTNDLAQPDVRGFYYHGHSDGNGIGYSELTPNDGIWARRLQLTLGNLYLPGTNGNPTIYQFRKPFTFIFMDGCLTAVGEFPEAFGIPRAVKAASYQNFNKRRRAFMGWASTTQNSIANNNFQLWTKRFWESWLNEPDYDNTLSQAVADAYTAYPALTNEAPLIIYGSPVLRWRD